MKFIHEKACVEGDVVLGEGVSVWPFASIRGDEGVVVIGDNTNIQDNAVIHGKTEIGKNVTIGHGAAVHQAKISDNVVIGINAVILDDAEIGDWCIVAAGSVVTPRTIVASGSMVMGTPGKVTRELEKDEMDYITASCQNYLNKIKTKQ